MSESMDQIWENVLRINHQGICITLQRKLTCLSLLACLNNITQVKLTLPNKSNRRSTNTWLSNGNLYSKKNSTIQMKNIYCNGTRHLNMNWFNVASSTSSNSGCCNPLMSNKKAQAYFGSKTRSFTYWWTLFKNCSLAWGKLICILQVRE